MDVLCFSVIHHDFMACLSNKCLLVIDTGDFLDLFLVNDNFLSRISVWNRAFLNYFILIDVSDNIQSLHVLQVYFLLRSNLSFDVSIRDVICNRI